MADLLKNGESSTSAGSSTPREGSIPLYLVNGVATVWDAQVAATLHCIHNISGLRAGTLPGVSQQNGFLGLPVTLMREETAYLVQQGIAHLVPLPKFPTLPSTEEISRHTTKRIERIRKLETAAREAEEEKKKISSELYEKGGEKARAKREARAKAKAEKEAKVREEGEGVFGASEDNKEVKEVSSTPMKNLVENIPTSNQPSPGYFLSIPSHPPIPPSPSPPSSSSSIITTLPHPLFPFPSTPREEALIGVFTSLQNQGYRMGLGPRFGGEYLIYPGDYLRYHAHFTSQVLVRDEHIRPAELVAWGRLGTGTKKAGLICCWDDRADGDGGVPEVEYYSLEWANFG